MDAKEERLRAEIKAEYEANFQEELKRYQKAIATEFAELDPDDPNTGDKARKKLIELVPPARNTIEELLVHAQSEAVRAGLAKFVFEQAMGKQKADDAQSEMRDLLKSLAKND